MTANRIELCGRLTSQPELRTTPSGTTVLRVTVDCGLPGEEMRLVVAMTGEEARPLAERLRAGQTVRVSGRLREVRARSKSGIQYAANEVVASEIRPSDEA